MRWYLDASVALHALLPEGDERARAWLDAAHDESAVYSSTLLRLELTRALRREQLDLGLAELTVKRISFISIDDGILRAAGAIEPHVKSLDAIHLATCQLLGTNVTVATHDATTRRAAQQLGFEIFDPLA